MFVEILWLLKGTEIMGLRCIIISGKTPFKILGYLIRTKFFDAKNSWPIFVVKILGLLKRTEILGLHFILIPGLTLVKILGYFLRTRFLHQTLMTCVTCENLGTLKEYKDIGPTSYPNPSLNTCQNLGLFHKTHVLWRRKPMAYFTWQNLGIFNENPQGFWDYIVSKFQVNMCQNLGIFLKNHVFWRQNTRGLLLLVKILGFLKNAKILVLHCIKVPGLKPVEILGYSLRTKFLTPKTHCLCVLSKSWGF